MGLKHLFFCQKDGQLHFLVYQKGEEIRLPHESDAPSTKKSFFFEQESFKGYLTEIKPNEQPFSQARWYFYRELPSLPLEDEQMLCALSFFFWKTFLPKKKKLYQKALFPYGEKNLDANNKMCNLYPGSFSPMHEGHLFCYRSQEDNPPILIPDCNPWKNSSLSPWQHYLQVIQFCEKNLSPKELKKLSIFPGLLSKKSNPTYSWLPLISSQIRLFLGSDSFISLPKWTEAKKLILKIDCLKVIQREDSFSDIEETLKEIRQINPKIEIEFIQQNPFSTLSSTHIRNGHQKSET